MLSAIELDDKSTLAAKEVSNERSYRHLPRKLVAAELPATEMTPQETFGIRRVVAEVSSAASGAFGALSHHVRMPTPGPSRKREG
ncbi:hypothetical protein GCM10022281_20630 [Sphingomonas rosea]|uniref:Transposase n=1 Tax=Sphingomonas rosea TaxID=335605 RepID=A0ABP7UBE5_9SPHN